MSETKSEQKKGWSWMGFLFAPMYYAGYGDIQKGFVLAIFGAIPLLGLGVFIYAGLKAKNELPIGKKDFKWLNAIGNFILFSIFSTVMSQVLTQSMTHSLSQQQSEEYAEEPFSCGNDDAIRLAEEIFADGYKEQLLDKNKFSLLMIGGRLAKKGYLDRSMTVSDTSWEKWIELSALDKGLDEIISSINQKSSVVAETFKIVDYKEVAKNDKSHSISCTGNILSSMANKFPIDYSVVVNGDEVKVRMSYDKSIFEWADSEVSDYR